MTTCKNCGAAFEGKYCPECGQKASTRRIVTRDLFTDLVKKLIPWDKGFLFTLRRLLSSPGKMVRSYLDGHRVAYSKPLSFLFLVTAVVLLAFDQDLFVRSMEANSGQNIQGNQQVMHLANWVFSHMSLVMLGLIPFLALCSKLFFRRESVNYAEHLVFNVYLMAGCMLLSIPLLIWVDLFGMIKPNPLVSFAGALPYLVFFSWGYAQFFTSGRPWLRVLKSLLVYGIGYLLYIFFIGLCVTIWLFLSTAF
ncbi:MAG TPA: DUF3667 domain-containing protein [Saprospiraceae bacterium]|nr:DUF3667 domain-containing protein [Saprospiraceae bacterium]